MNTPDQAEGLKPTGAPMTGETTGAEGLKPDFLEPYESMGAAIAFAEAVLIDVGKEAAAQDLHAVLIQLSGLRSKSLASPTPSPREQALEEALNYWLAQFENFRADDGNYADAYYCFIKGHGAAWAQTRALLNPEQSHG